MVEPTIMTEHQEDRGRKMQTYTNVDDFLNAGRSAMNVVEPSEPYNFSTEITIDKLTKDEPFRVISEYMEDRFGMTEDKHSREDIVDSYINNMRSFAVGNSITTLQELSHLNRGKDNDLQVRRNKAGNAYKLFDSMKGVYASGTTGDQIDAAYDYGKALIVDPVNLLSLGVGKLVASGATKGAVEVLKAAAREAGKKSLAESAKKGLVTKSVIDRNKREASRRAYSAAMKSAAYKEALKPAAKREVIGTGAFDTLAGVGTDYLEQSARIKAGAMDEYDPIQGTFATLGGLTGGLLAYGLVKFKGVSGNAILSEELERVSQIKSSATETTGDLTEEALKESVENADGSAIKEAVKTMQENLEPFIAKVRRGIDVRYEDLDDKSTATDAVLGRLFFLGDAKYNIKGVAQILEDAGVAPYSKRIEGDRFTNYLLDVVKTLDPEAKKAVEDAFESIFGKFDSPAGRLGLEKFLDVDAAEVSDAARLLQRQSQLEKTLRSINKESTAAEVIESILDEVTVPIRENVAKTFGDVQQNFIRMLVTHPGTTALNVIGWASASGTQTMSDMLRATLYGGTSMLSSLMGNKTSAVEYGNRARQMAALQKQKFMNMVDPYSTFEAAMDYLTFRPEAQKEMFRYMIGGVEVDAVLKELELPAGETLSRTNFEKFMNLAQTAYGVKAQDFFTKSQEFMYALDKNIRLEFGVSYNEFLKRDDLAAQLVDKNSNSYKKFLKIETKSINDALRNTFSKRYGGNKGLLPRVAKVVEEARTYPIIGAMVPFGQFFNNTLGFMFDHTGASLIHKGFTGNDRDPFDLATKAAVGWGIIGVTTAREAANFEEGLAWHQERNAKGAIVDRRYDFPYSFYKMIGRMGCHLARDGRIPPQLFEEATKQFGIEQLSRQLGDAASGAFETMKLFASGELEAAVDSGVKAIKSSASMYASGFTRFADPANQIIALSRGEDYEAIDRKQGSRFVNDSARYIDQIYEALSTGEPLAPEKKSALSDEPQGAAIGRIFGYREVLPQSTIQTLFNEVGRPQWQTDIRSDVPEVANAFNEFVFPVLEMYADAIVESGKWQQLSGADKEKQLRTILQVAKKATKKSLMASFNTDDNKVGLLYTITNRNINKKEMRDTLEIFGVDEKELWQLDLPQLQLIDFYLSNQRERDELFKLNLN